MTQANKPLEARAGLNIGIEPDLGLFIQDCGAKEKTLNTALGAENVILECPERVARTPIPTGAGQGMIFNTTAVDFHYRTYFRDQDGNEIPLFNLVDPPPNVAAGVSADFQYHDGRLNKTGFTLTPGQKIILRPVAAPPQ